MEIDELGTRLHNRRYGSTAKEILELGMAAATTKRRLSAEQRNAWLQEHQIHADTFSKAVSIGSSPSLQRPDIANHLPASFSVLAMLSRWNEKELNKALNDEIVTPTTTYRELERWHKESCLEQEQVHGPFIVQPLVIATEPIQQHIDLISATIAINKALEDQGIKGHVILLNNWNNIEQQAQEQWANWRLESLCKEFNDDYATNTLTLELLSQPLVEFRRVLKHLDIPEYEDAYAIWNGYQAVFGDSKHRRYAAKQRLISQVHKGSNLAKTVAMEVLGSPPEKATVTRGSGEG